MTIVGLVSQASSSARGDDPHASVRDPPLGPSSELPLPSSPSPSPSPLPTPGHSSTRLCRPPTTTAAPTTAACQAPRAPLRMFREPPRQAHTVGATGATGALGRCLAGMQVGRLDAALICLGAGALGGLGAGAGTAALADVGGTVAGLLALAGTAGGVATLLARPQAPHPAVRPTRQKIVPWVVGGTLAWGQLASENLLAAGCVTAVLVLPGVYVADRIDVVATAPVTPEEHTPDPAAPIARAAVAVAISAVASRAFNHEGMKAFCWVVGTNAAAACGALVMRRIANAWVDAWPAGVSGRRGRR